MQRYGRGAGRGAGRGGLGGEGDERDGGLRGAAAAVVGSGAFPSSPLPGGVVHGAGAPVHIPAAGGSKPVLQCRVLLLDGTEVNVELPVSSARLPPPPAKRCLQLPSPLLRIVPPLSGDTHLRVPPPGRTTGAVRRESLASFVLPSAGALAAVSARMHLLPGARRASPP